MILFTSGVKKISIGVVILVVLFVIGFFIGIKTDKTTGRATVSWKPNTDTNLAGYKVYFGTEPRKSDVAADSGYPNNIDAKMETSVKINNLRLFKTYYFSTTAYNAKGLESKLSSPEMSKKIGLRDIFKK